MRAWKALAAVLGLAVLAVPLGSRAPASAQQTAVVTLGPINVGVAETGTVEGRLACPAGNCAGFSVVLNFNRDLLRVESAAVGTVLGAGVTTSLNRVDNVLGVVWLSASGAPGTSEGVLFTLQVGGLVPGAADITVNQLTVTDSSGAKLVASGTGTTVTVVETGKIAFFSPPANGWDVVFTSERDGNPEIYAAAADGSNVRRLTDNLTLDGGPTWSPDGRLIAFHSERDGNREIYVMAEDGTDVRRLTDNPTPDSDPAWSPDGRRIVFTAQRDGNAELYVMNADGSSPQRLTNDPAQDTFAAWAPNGSKIAFSSDRGGASEILLMNADGSGPAPITILFGANGWYPAWTPNGSLLAFSVERDPDIADIYRTTPQGSDAARLTDPSDRLTSMDWSPDGAWLAYAGTPDGNKDVLVMDQEGQQIFRITNDPADDYDPDWRAIRIVAEQPCAIRTDQDQIVLRVGPGTNRGIFGWLPPHQDFTVVSQATDGDGALWWELDKTQVEGHEMVLSLWVAADDVEESGDCGAVPEGTPPPIINIPQVTPRQPGTWGGCGSCESCGHPGNECVLAPDGQCLWDPQTCGDVPPPGSGCFTVSTGVLPNSRYGSVGVQPAQNCPTGGGYTTGTYVTVTLYTQVSGVGFHWTGTCPGASGSSLSFSFNITYSCSAIASFP